jgi:hypothetical protein
MPVRLWRAITQNDGKSTAFRNWLLNRFRENRNSNVQCLKIIGEIKTISPKPVDISAPRGHRQGA